MSTPLIMVNRVYGRLGVETITAFTDATDRADLANSNYNILAESFLLEHPWRFTSLWVLIARNAVPVDVAPSPSPYTYALPVAMIGQPLRIENDRRTPIRQDWEVIAGNILRTVVDEGTSLFLKHQSRVDEAAWPSDFVEYALCALCAKWALPLTDDRDLAVEWRGHAKMALDRAMTNDEKGAPPIQAVTSFPFTDPYYEG